MSKTRFDRCCRTNKAGVQQQRSILNSRIQRQFQKKFSCQTEEKYPSHKQKDKERQGIKENTSYLTYIGDTIDQGATRLGGYT